MNASIPYQLAKQFFYLGFDQVTLKKYSSQSHHLCDITGDIPAPTYAEILSWFEDVKQIWVDRKTIIQSDKLNGFEYWVRSSKFDQCKIGFYPTQESGELDSLQFILKFLKNESEITT
jgi:hypothetical protein